MSNRGDRRAVKNWNQKNKKNNKVVVDEICNICGLHNLGFPGIYYGFCIHKNGYLHTSDIYWPHQHKLREQWLIDNPDAKYLGWVSI